MTSSRGALIAAAIGAAVVIAAAGSRPRATAALVVGVLAALPAVIVASVASGILDSPGGTPGRPEATVCLALGIGILFAAVAGPALVVARQSRSGSPGCGCATCWPRPSPLSWPWS